MMHAIELKSDHSFFRKMLFLFLGIGENYMCPSEWNELNRKQLLHLAHEIFTEKDIYETKLKLSQQLTGIPKIAFNWISNEDKVFLAEQIEWVMTSKVVLTNQLLPQVGKYYGPASNFDNLTIGEFLFADRFFLRYLKNRKQNDLDSFIAIIYRRRKKVVDKTSPDYDGDERELFNNNTVDLRIPKVKRWKPQIKHATLLWYQGCRDEFVRTHPSLFAKKEGGESHPLGLYAIISDLSPRFGTVDVTMHVKLKSFSLEWEKAIHDSEKIKEKSKERK